MAKQTLDLLDVVMIQDGTDLEPTNRQHFLLKFGTRHRQPNNPIQKSLLPPHNYYTPSSEHVAQIKLVQEALCNAMGTSISTALLQQARHTQDSHTTTMAVLCGDVIRPKDKRWSAKFYISVTVLMANFRYLWVIFAP